MEPSALFSSLRSIEDQSLMRRLHRIIVGIMVALFLIGYPIAAVGIGEKWIEIMAWKARVNETIVSRAK